MFCTKSETQQEKKWDDYNKDYWENISNHDFIDVITVYYFANGLNWSEIWSVLAKKVKVKVH